MPIDISNADDLRTVYLQTYDGFAITPSDVRDANKHINLRYARELLGALVHGGLVTISEGGEGDVWQTSPDTYDTMSREEAEARIDGWLAPQTPQSATSTSKPAKSASKDPHDCLCGCGSTITTKALFRPGHDARMAGQVGREIAAIMNGGHDEGDQIKINALIESLPTPALQAKAHRVAETANRKNLKAAKPEYPDVDGIVKVGKNEYPAKREASGVVRFLKPGASEWQSASKTAAKTFQEG